MKKILSVLVMLSVMLGIVGMTFAATGGDQEVVVNVTGFAECSISPLSINYGSIIPGTTSDPQTTTIDLGASTMNVDLMIKLLAGSHPIFENIWYELNDTGSDFESKLNAVTLKKLLIESNTYNLMSVLMVPTGTQPVSGANGTVKYTCAAAPECSDGDDNADAEDTLADADDPGCLSGQGGTYNPSDDDETDPAPVTECNNGLDDDQDGDIDLADPSCANAADNDETNPTQCSDGVDNVDPEDVLVDFPADPGCIDALDNDETAPLPLCMDGLDNDLDGKTDFSGGDLGCSTATDNTETDALLICDDGLDNDGDTFVDLLDIGCLDGDTTSELGATECSDGLDNEILPDTLIDFPVDLQCTDAADNDESA